MDEHSEKFNEELENIQRNQMKLNKIITETNKYTFFIYKESRVDLRTQKNESTNCKKVQQKSPNLKRKRKKFLNEDETFGTISSILTFTLQIFQKDKREENLIEDIIGENVPKLERIRLADLGSTESLSNKMNPEIHAKKHCGYSGKT